MIDCILIIFPITRHDMPLDWLITGSGPNCSDLLALVDALDLSKRDRSRSSPKKTGAHMEEMQPLLLTPYLVFMQQSRREYSRSLLCYKTSFEGKAHLMEFIKRNVELALQSPATLPVPMSLVNHKYSIDIIASILIGWIGICRPRYLEDLCVACI
jgi:hypothetical protein